MAGRRLASRLLAAALAGGGGGGPPLFAAGQEAAALAIGRGAAPSSSAAAAKNLSTSASAWRTPTGATLPKRTAHALAVSDDNGEGGGGSTTASPARRGKGNTSTSAPAVAGDKATARGGKAGPSTTGQTGRGTAAAAAASSSQDGEGGGGQARRRWTPQHRRGSHASPRPTSTSGGGGGGGGWTEWSPAPVVGGLADADDGKGQRRRTTGWQQQRGQRDGQGGGGGFHRGGRGQASTSSAGRVMDDGGDRRRQWHQRGQHGNNSNNYGRHHQQQWSSDREGGPSQNRRWQPRNQGGGGGGGGWVPDPDDRPAGQGRRDGRRWTARGGGGGADAPSGGYANNNNNNNNNWRQEPWRRRGYDRPDVAAEAEAAAAERRRKAAAAAAAAAASASRAAADADIPIPAGVTVRELARLLDVGVAALEDALADMGARPGSEEDTVEPDAAELVALELGKAVAVERPPAPADGATAPPRPPVVAVLGHVDHGKTTLLDALRDTAVAAGEAGGITQHIGAFEVAMPGSASTITFLDTPGHAAFSAMRSRGAHLTDIAVLVVDARDGVKPQTREAIAHIRAAGCPLVVALTKCDLPDADPAGVRQQLLGEGLELEEAGGTVQAVEVAAKAGRGLAELEDALLLQAELMELRAAQAGRPAEATVVEARMDKGQGPVATVIVTAGTLEPGQAVVVGSEWGKVRSLAGADGAPVDRVLPGHPAEVTGLRGVPQAGDTLAVLASEDRARRLSAARAQRAEERRQAATAVGAAEAVAADAAAAAVAAASRKAARRGASASAVSAAAQAAADLAAANEAAAAAAGTRVLLVVKADTQGSAEAATHALEALALDGVRVSVAASAVGPVTLSDVQHAAAIGARVLAFGVRTGGPPVEREAKRLGVDVAGERVIYRLLDAVAGWVAGAAPRVGREVVSGRAEVLQVFTSATGAVAGVRVGEGALAKGETVRVVRGGATVHEGACTSLRRHKLDVDRVGRGTECGVVIDGFSAFEAGDVLQTVVVEYVTPRAEDVLAKANEG